MKFMNGQNASVFSLAGKTGLEHSGAQGDGDGFRFSSSGRSVPSTFSYARTMVLFLHARLTAMKVQKTTSSKIPKVSPKEDGEKGLASRVLPFSSSRRWDTGR